MKNFKTHRFFALLLAIVSFSFVFLGVSEEAFADKKSEKDAYSVLIKQGAAAFNNDDCALAYQKFEQAYALKPSTDLVYNMGRTCECDGQFQKAVEYYTQFIASKDVDHEARMDALERINALNQVIALVKHPGSSTASVGVGTPAVAAPAAGSAVAGGCVDINTASQAQLETIKGIGASKAQLIMGGRPYARVDDLLKVKGIGEKTLEKWRPFFCPISSAAPEAAQSAPAVAPPVGVAPPAPPVAPTPAAAPDAPAKSKQPVKPLLDSGIGESFDL